MKQVTVAECPNMLVWWNQLQVLSSPSTKQSTIPCCSTLFVIVIVISRAWLFPVLLTWMLRSVFFLNVLACTKRLYLPYIWPEMQMQFSSEGISCVWMKNQNIYDVLNNIALILSWQQILEFFLCKCLSQYRTDNVCCFAPTSEQKWEVLERWHDLSWQYLFSSTLKLEQSKHLRISATKVAHDYSFLCCLLQMYIVSHEKELELSLNAPFLCQRS